MSRTIKIAAILSNYFITIVSYEQYSEVFLEDMYTVCDYLHIDISLGMPECSFEHNIHFILRCLLEGKHQVYCWPQYVWDIEWIAL